MTWPQTRIHVLMVVRLSFDHFNHQFPCDLSLVKVDAVLLLARFWKGLEFQIPIIERLSYLQLQKIVQETCVLSL